MRHVTLDMRSSLLDIQRTPNNRPPPSTAVIRMHIQPGDGLRRSQNDGQLQLCVPSVTTWWLVLISRSLPAPSRARLRGEPRTHTAHNALRALAPLRFGALALWRFEGIIPAQGRQLAQLAGGCGVPHVLFGLVGEWPARQAWAY